VLSLSGSRNPLQEGLTPLQAFEVLSDLQSRAAYDKDANGFTKASGEYSLDAALALFERFFSTVRPAQI
jgi:curved DNA-binding protein CbpA